MCLSPLLSHTFFGIFAMFLTVCHFATTCPPERLGTKFLPSPPSVPPDVLSFSVRSPGEFLRTHV